MALFQRERKVVFEGSQKKYPQVELPKWMREIEIAENE